MLRHKHLVFDEYVAPNTTTPTHERFNHVLGAFDQLALMAVVDNVTGTGSFNMWLSHSADNRLWLYRPTEVMTRPGSGNIQLAGFATNPLNAATFSDDGSLPLFAFVRLEVGFSGAATSGHVKLYAVQRDQGG